MYEVNVRIFVFCVSLFFTSYVFAKSEKFEVKSKLVKHDGFMSENQVFNGFGCMGKNVSPDLEWKHAPKDTKFYAVTMFDPDAPTGSGWWHWIVFNIPSSVTKMTAGTVPVGAVQGRTDFGKPGYGGPCPPPGAPHHYVFKVYALKEALNLNEDASAAMVSFQLNANKLAEASLTAKYGRK